MRQHNNLGSMITDEIKQHKDVNIQLVFQQAEKLQEQYRNKYNTYTTTEERLKQETFAYLIIKGNLEKGYYRK